MQRVHRKGFAARLLVTVFVSLVTVAMNSPANASSSTALLSGFSKELSELDSIMEEASNKLSTNKMENEKTYLSLVSQILEEHSTALKSISINLSSRLENSKKSLLDAQSKWSKVNKVKLTTGFFGGDLQRITNVLECIAPYSDGSSPTLLVKRYCANNEGHPKPGDRVPGNPMMVYGGADWQKDDVTTINFINAENKYLIEGIKLGFVIPLNSSEYEATRLVISNSKLEIEQLTKEIDSATKLANNNRDSKKYEAQQQYSMQLTKLSSDHDIEMTSLENQRSALLFGQKAAKRAVRQGGNLKTALTIAVRFAYNQKRLDELARAPLDYVTSLKALNSAVKITALSEAADAVDASYSNQKASKINSICGRAFTKESKFKKINSKAMAVYSKYVGK